MSNQDLNKRGQNKYKRTSFYSVLTLLALLAAPTQGISQEDLSDLELFESELKKDSWAPPPPASMPLESAAPTKQVSDLRELTPFTEIAVIQRRYQPKSDRFQVVGSLGALVNDPWFESFSVALRLGYHLTEKWGVEVVYKGLSSSEGENAKDLFNQLAVKTSSFVTPKSYTGIHLVWSPIYGKMDFSNRKIVPFDMFFNLGYGQTNIDGAKTKEAGTFHVGVGQMFALSKDFSVRWDLMLNSFEATSLTENQQDRFNNLILLGGISYFFPGVKYR